MDKVTFKLNRDQFSGAVKTEWLENEPRKMMLLNDLNFTDSQGKVWIAMYGSIIDGASIPEIFWPLIGSPFVGFYRRSTVLHDVYCQNHLRPSKAVHRMFWEAMIADGVTKEKADIMYKAVKNFGPRW